MAWVTTRGLTTVKNEFNVVFPGRDRASDGAVGDLAHQTGASGHNPDRTGKAEWRDGDAKDEVRAIDVDADLVPGSKIDWMELVVQYLVKRARAGLYVPFQYIIYKGRIWSRSDSWKTRTYTGKNKHGEHAHFSGAYNQTADEWTGSLGLATLRGSQTGGWMFCKKGDSGDEVKYLQYRLHNLGFNIVGGVDGDYGDSTARALAAAVKSFNGSAINGQVYGPEQMIFLDILFIRRYSVVVTGPQGPQGPSGPEGPAGPQGLPGRDGVLTGTLTVRGGTLEVATEQEEGQV